MSNKPYSLSCKGVVRDPAGRILILQRAATSGFNAGKWEFPGGKVDPGERVEVALQREVREETGLAITVERIVGAGESELPDRKVAYLFFETGTESTDVRLSSEHDAFRWVARGDLAGVDFWCFDIFSSGKTTGASLCE